MTDTPQPGRAASPTASPAASPAGSGRSGAGLSAAECRLGAPLDPGRVKAVGRPDLARATRTGTATMAIATSLGPIEVTMDRARTPCTVASFEYLAGKRFYDGTSCHRLVDSQIFVLQCGDPLGDGTGGPDYQFADENLTGAEYRRGVVAMANAGPDTNGSQFFFVFRDSDLPASYTVFGQVSVGMEVIDQVAAGGQDGAYGSAAGGGHPKTPLVLRSLSVS